MTTRCVLLRPTAPRTKSTSRRPGVPASCTLSVAGAACAVVVVCRGLMGCCCWVCGCRLVPEVMGKPDTAGAVPPAVVMALPAGGAPAPTAGWRCEMCTYVCRVYRLRAVGMCMARRLTKTRCSLLGCAQVRQSGRIPHRMQHVRHAETQRRCNGGQPTRRSDIRHSCVGGRVRLRR